MNDLLSAPARLLRGFAVDFLTCHDLNEVLRIMEPDYRLTIGAHVFEGRDHQYLPATAAQLEQFPGLCVTVHDVILGPNAVAMRFTEHGVSTRHKGRSAAWGGVTLFELNNGRFQYGWAEEDYIARKRQLSIGQCDPIRPPHPSPWDVAVEARSEAAESVVRAWLKGSRGLQGDHHLEEISEQGPRFDDLIAVEEFRVDALFSAGERVAFHAVCHGRYAGGFGDRGPSRDGAPIELGLAAMLSVRDGHITQAQVAYDRLGLHRRLTENASGP